MIRFTIIILLSFGICSCTKKVPFEINNFKALNNYIDSNTNLKTLLLDYNGAYENGFTIPSVNQTSDGFFEASFQIKNNETDNKKFYYKIFYQNESYKFDEKHEFANENFYGSWEDVNTTFVETQEILADNNFHEVTTKFRIVGNPRDEKKYYGSNQIGPISKEETDGVINSIKNIPEWYNLIVEKAKQNNQTIEKQLYLDAIFVAKQKREEGNFNNRWKRNPRVGEYKFMLVIVSDSIELKNIPDFVKNISLTDTSKHFVNPFSYFSQLNTENRNILILSSEDKLKVKASPNMGDGIYVNSSSFSKPSFDTSYYNSRCNNSHNLMVKAPFEQFISSYNPHFKFKNVPIVADVHGGEYTKEDYYANLKKTHDFISTPIEVAPCPCKNVSLDAENKIILKNSATKKGEWRKENVGVISRNGFTYGKYRVKAKMPELLNKDNLWNGLTNAIWLIYQQGNWNTRRTCYKNGYVPKSYPGEGVISYVPTDVYSEIDIEIVKASRNWPLSSYGGDTSKKPTDPISDSNKVMITYTNWDLACQDPINFSRGVFNLNYNKIDYSLHRWDNWYQAVTGKYAEYDDELFTGPYYWFEIEWKPEEIIWRVGPEKNKMREIGYVNSTVSSIPNNQMLLIVTQEWHLENWWPEAPFNQNFIPFPSKEIKGEVLEFEIE